MNNLTPEDKTYLRQFLEKKFSLTELKNLAFDLAIDYQDLPHSNKKEFALELFFDCDRKSSLDKLANLMYQSRPDDRLGSIMAGSGSFSAKSQPAAHSASDGPEVASAPSRNKPNPGQKQVDAQQRKDFFISYNHADEQWAEWIAWVLEEAGYKLIIQAWDFTPGNSFVLKMQHAATVSDRTLAVLSPDYLTSGFAAAEWAAAFAQDPRGEKGTLVPVRIRDCKLEGLLPQIIYIDLVGLAEPAAREKLLKGVQRGRKKPASKPGFPGTPSSGLPATKPSFPGPGEEFDINRMEEAKTESVTELKRILSGIGWNRDDLRKIEEYFELCAPPGWPFTAKTKIVRDRIGEMVDSLAETMTQDTGRSPFVEFAISLSEVKPDSKQAIYSWFNAYASLWGGIHSLPDIRNELKQLKKKQHQGDIYLLVTLDKVLPDQSYYKLQAWTMDQKGKNRKPLPLSDKNLTLAEVEQELRKAIQLGHKKAGNNSALQLEIFLPEELLFQLHLDEWKPSEYSTTNVGLAYPVALRSLDRLKALDANSELYKIWITKWKQANAPLRHYSCKLEDFNKEGTALILKWQDEARACLSLPFVPGELGARTKNLTHLIIEAGIPVAFWPKHSVGGRPQVDPALARLLLDCEHPERLPGRLQKMRRDWLKSGNKKSGNAGYNLCLLLDNPERLPAHYRRGLQMS